MCPDDEHPMAPTSLEAMHMILVGQDSRVRLDLLTLGCPVDEGILFELFKRKVNRLAQRLLAVESLGSHVKDQSHVLVVIHVADLLGGCHTNLEGCVHIEEGADARDNAILLDSLKLSIKV